MDRFLHGAWKTHEWLSFLAGLPVTLLVWLMARAWPRRGPASLYR